jgi:hypothetical protein
MAAVTVAFFAPFGGDARRGIIWYQPQWDTTRSGHTVERLCTVPIGGSTMVLGGKMRKFYRTGVFGFRTRNDRAVRRKTDCCKSWYLFYTL